MVLLTINEEKKLRKNLCSFLKKKFSAKIHPHYKIFDNFAPDYCVLKKRKKRIILFRNPPSFPEGDIEEIKYALKSGIAVYIATITNGPYDEKLLESLINECDTYGVGVIQCSSSRNIKIRQPSILDFPQDQIIETKIKVFVSSKLWIDEREICHKVIRDSKHQPICVERILLTGPVESECLDWIDKSPFFIGIITSNYRPLVNKEIRYALKKKKGRCLIFLHKDCSRCLDKKLLSLKTFVSKNVTYSSYSSQEQLKKQLSKKLTELISKNVPEK